MTRHVPGTHKHQLLRSPTAVPQVSWDSESWTPVTPPQADSQGPGAKPSQAVCRVGRSPRGRGSCQSPQGPSSRTHTGCLHWQQSGTTGLKNSVLPSADGRSQRGDQAHRACATSRNANCSAKHQNKPAEPPWTQETPAALVAPALAPPPAPPTHRVADESKGLGLVHRATSR